MEDMSTRTAVIIHRREGLEFKTDPMPATRANEIWAALSSKGFKAPHMELRFICERCRIQPVEHETSDGLALCAGCAQDTHVLCRTCSDVVPIAEIEYGLDQCLACRVHDADRYDKGNAEMRRGLFEAERILLWLIYMGDDKPAGFGSLNAGLALAGVRKAHHPG